MSENFKYQCGGDAIIALVVDGEIGEDAIGEHGLVWDEKSGLARAPDTISANNVEDEENLLQMTSFAQETCTCLLSRSASDHEVALDALAFSPGTSMRDDDINALTQNKPLCIHGNEIVAMKMGSLQRYKKAIIELCDKTLTFSDRFQKLNIAWESLPSLLAKSTPDASKTLFYWVVRHTLYLMLGCEWMKLSQNKILEIRTKIVKSMKSNTSTVTTTSERLLYILKNLDNPWRDERLIAVVNGEPRLLTQDDLDCLTTESGCMIVLRLQKLCETKCDDLAFKLCSKTLLALRSIHKNHDLRRSTSVGHIYFIYDVYLCFVHKYVGVYKFIEEVRRLGLYDALLLIRRNVNSEASNSRLMKLRNKVANLAANIIIATVMVENLNDDNAHLYCAIMKEWFRMHQRIPVEKFREIARRLFTTAISAKHLHLACVVIKQLNIEGFNELLLELYVRILTGELNVLELLKSDESCSAEVLIDNEVILSYRYLQIADLLQDTQPDLAHECILTAFSLNPTKLNYDLVKSVAYTKFKHRDAISTNEEPKPLRFSDKTTAELNAVVNKEKLNLADALNVPYRFIDHTYEASTIQPPVKETLNFANQIERDISALLSSPRVKFLSWLQSWNELDTNCQKLLRPGGKLEIVRQSLAVANDYLQYLNLDYYQFRDLPEIDGPGIEKGYEISVNFDEEVSNKGSDEVSDDNTRKKGSSKRQQKHNKKSKSVSHSAQPRESTSADKEENIEKSSSNPTDNSLSAEEWFMMYVRVLACGKDVEESQIEELNEKYRTLKAQHEVKKREASQQSSDDKYNIKSKSVSHSAQPRESTSAGREENSEKSRPQSSECACTSLTVSDKALAAASHSKKAFQKTSVMRTSDSGSHRKDQVRDSQSTSKPAEHMHLAEDTPVGESGNKTLARDLNLSTEVDCFGYPDSPLDLQTCRSRNTNVISKTAGNIPAAKQPKIGDQINQNDSVNTSGAATSVIDSTASNTVLDLKMKPLQGRIPVPKINIVQPGDAHQNRSSKLKSPSQHLKGNPPIKPSVNAVDPSNNRVPSNVVLQNRGDFRGLLNNSEPIPGTSTGTQTKICSSPNSGVQIDDTNDTQSSTVVSSNDPEFSDSSDVFLQNEPETEDIRPKTNFAQYNTVREFIQTRYTMNAYQERGPYDGHETYNVVISRNHVYQVSNRYGYDQPPHAQMHNYDMPDHNPQEQMHNYAMPDHDPKARMHNYAMPEHNRHEQMHNYAMPDHNYAMPDHSYAMPDPNPLARMYNYAMPDHNPHARMHNCAMPDHNPHARMHNYDMPDHNPHAQMHNYAMPDHNPHVRMRNYAMPDHHPHAQMYNYAMPDQYNQQPCDGNTVQDVQCPKFAHQHYVPHRMGDMHRMASEPLDYSLIDEFLASETRRNQGEPVPPQNCYRSEHLGDFHEPMLNELETAATPRVVPVHSRYETTVVAPNSENIDQKSLSSDDVGENTGESQKIVEISDSETEEEAEEGIDIDFKKQTTNKPDTDSDGDSSDSCDLVPNFAHQNYVPHRMGDMHRMASEPLDYSLIDEFLASETRRNQGEPVPPQNCYRSEHLGDFHEPMLNELETAATPRVVPVHSRYETTVVAPNSENIDQKSLSSDDVGENTGESQKIVEISDSETEEEAEEGIDIDFKKQTTNKPDTDSDGDSSDSCDLVVQKPHRTYSRLSAGSEHSNTSPKQRSPPSQNRSGGQHTENIAMITHGSGDIHFRKPFAKPIAKELEMLHREAPLETAKTPLYSWVEITEIPDPSDKIRVFRGQILKRVQNRPTCKYMQKVAKRKKNLSNCSELATKKRHGYAFKKRNGKSSRRQMNWPRFSKQEMEMMTKVKVVLERLTLDEIRMHTKRSFNSNIAATRRSTSIRGSSKCSVGFETKSSDKNPRKRFHSPLPHCTSKISKFDSI